MRSLLAATLLVLTVSGCTSCSNQKKVEEAQQQQAEDIIEANRRILEEETRRIDTYIEERNLEMERSRTGLRYKIEPLGSGPTPLPGEVATIEYTTHFIDGTVLGPEEKSTMNIWVNQDYTIRGLLEGVQMLRVGDNAKFILPSHLAYGVHGVPGEIPSRATVVFDVTLIAIKSL